VDVTAAVKCRHGGVGGRSGAELRGRLLRRPDPTAGRMKQAHAGGVECQVSGAKLTFPTPGQGSFRRRVGFARL